ncbi:hypothetical protein NliqN6_0675 [Naganishia liquefaciens]|uniref:RRM domain-containing protein n=1 Tax=Naganishia liquefaciens TaxID=104408 RepID=A0A8H3TNY9_9TREE|nr:hypothetical protein NliqN6_0675 [Naganishia liquefaciens]
MSAQPPPNPGATAAAKQGTSAPTTTQQRQRPHPLPHEFSTDPRVHFDRAVGKWQYEDETNGQEFEWNELGQTWIPVISDDLIKAQQAAYAIQGVDENEAVAPKRHIENQRKRKQAEIDYTSNEPIPSASTGLPPPPGSELAANSRPAKVVKPRPVTDVYVSNLPPRTTVDLLARIFGRAGLLMTDDEGNPKIKLYTDESGAFKGDALVSYFKGESVDLAVTLFDDTELEMGSGEGNIHVSKAEYKNKASRDEQQEEKRAKQANSDAAKPADLGIGVAKQPAKKGKKPKEKTEDQKRAAKRIRNLQSKLEDWSSDSDNEDPAAPLGGAPQPGNNRMLRVVVLKHMFTLKELDEDPGLALELKEDVREEAETIGTVTNIHLFDKEDDGVMTIKFKDAISAQACLLKMNGRFFGGRQIQASLYDGKEQFKASGKNDGFLDPDEREAEEKQRLDRFAAWLVDERGDDGEDTPA